MIIADVSVVLAAFRADHPHHAVVRPWFDEVLAEESSIAVPDLVWVGPFLHLAIASSAPANLATDAYLAAIALAWAAPVATLDRDFRRFDGLRIIEPGA